MTVLALCAAAGLALQDDANELRARALEHYAKGKYEEAIAAEKAALDAYALDDHPMQVALSWANLALYQSRLARMQETVDACVEAIRLGKRHTVAAAEDTAYSVLYQLVPSATEWNAPAFDRLFDAIYRAVEGGDAHGLDQSRNLKIAYLRQRNDRASAVRVSTWLVDLHRKERDSYGETRALLDRGNLRYESNDFERATEDYRAALALAQEHGDMESVGWARANIGRTLARREPGAPAEVEMNAALAAFESCDCTDGLRDVLGQLVALAESTKDPEKKRAAEKRLRTLRTPVPDRSAAKFEEAPSLADKELRDVIIEVRWDGKEFHFSGAAVPDGHRVIAREAWGTVDFNGTELEICRGKVRYGRLVFLKTGEIAELTMGGTLRRKRIE